MRPSDLKTAVFRDGETLADICREFLGEGPRPIPATILASSFCGVLALLLWGFYLSDGETNEIEKFVAAMAGLLVAALGALLGVSIAGFALFATSLRPDVLAVLLKRRRRKSGVIYLRYMYGMFVFVIRSMIVALVWCVILFVAFGGMVPSGMLFVMLGEHVYRFFACLAALVLVWQAIYVFGVFYSFLRNLHQLLLVVAAFSVPRG